MSLSTPSLGLRLGLGPSSPPKKRSGLLSSSARGHAGHPPLENEGRPRRMSLPSPLQICTSPGAQTLPSGMVDLGARALSSRLDRALLMRSSSIVSSLSFQSSADKRKAKTDPFEDFRQDRDKQRRQAESKRVSEEAYVRFCKEELRFKATLAKLSETEDSSRWMLDYPDVWRSVRPLSSPDKLMQKEVRRLQQTMYRSLRQLCRTDPIAVQAWIEAEEARTAAEAEAVASLKETLQRPDSREPGGDGVRIFQSDLGGIFKDRFRRDAKVVEEELAAQC